MRSPAGLGRFFLFGLTHLRHDFGSKIARFLFYPFPNDIQGKTVDLGGFFCEQLFHRLIRIFDKGLPQKCYLGEVFGNTAIDHARNDIGRLPALRCLGGIYLAFTLQQLRRDLFA